MDRNVIAVQKEGRIQKKYHSRYETALYTGLTPSFLSEAANDPKNPIPHFKIGRSQRTYAFRFDEVDAWLETFRVAKLKS